MKLSIKFKDMVRVKDVEVKQEGKGDDKHSSLLITLDGVAPGNSLDALMGCYGDETVTKIFWKDNEHKEARFRPLQRSKLNGVHYNTTLTLDDEKFDNCRALSASFKCLDEGLVSLDIKVVVSHPTPEEEHAILELFKKSAVCSIEGDPGLFDDDKPDKSEEEDDGQESMFDTEDDDPEDDDDADGEGEEETAAESTEPNDDPQDGEDPRYDEAVQIVRGTRSVNTSKLQRALNVGPNRVAVMLHQMEEEELIGPASSSGRRAIIMSPDYQGANLEAVK